MGKFFMLYINLKQFGRNLTTLAISKYLANIIEGFIGICQNFEPFWANFSCFWAKYHCCKWPNIE